MEQEKVLAWHFIRDDGRTQYGSILVKAGQTYSTDSKTILCEQGFHASERLLDALGYAPGAMLCRVELWGDLKRGRDKIVAQNRHVQWMLDVTRLLHGFACDVTEETLRKHGVTDERSWNAIRVKREWMDGKATDEELAAAWAAACDAAWDAAWNSVRNAARNAAKDPEKVTAWNAARTAVWEAEREAAWNAACGAAWDVAWDAVLDVARAATRDATRDATWDATWVELNARLEAQVLQLAGSVGYQS